MRTRSWLATSLLLFALVVSRDARAGTPRFILTATTPVQLQLTHGATATVQYRVTNNARFAETLTLVPLRGVAQISSSAGACSAHFRLEYHQSCMLVLAVTADEVPASGQHGGPVVCQANNANLCYQPAPTQALSISVAAPTPH